MSTATPHHTTAANGTVAPLVRTSSLFHSVTPQPHVLTIWNIQLAFHLLSITPPAIKSQVKYQGWPHHSMFYQTPVNKNLRAPNR